MSNNHSDGQGRGRGRGRGAMLKRKPDAKPGIHQKGLSSSNSNGQGDVVSYEVDDVLIALRSLPLEMTTEQLDHLAEAVRQYATTPDRLGLAAVTLRRRCNDNWHLAESAARLANRLVALKIGRASFRASIIACIHEDYNAAAQLYEDSPSCFLGLVALMSQLFVHMLLLNSKPIAMLVNPILSVLEIVFDGEASDDEMICGATQLLTTGALLHESADDANLSRLRHLVQMVRDKVIDGHGSAQPRFMMINLVEAAASNWTQVKTGRAPSQ